MEYTINQLAHLAGVSTRTLRYYDQMGLLCPGRISSNGYRIYREQEVNRLQQILFYRALGVGLAEIKKILEAENYDGLTALEGHLLALQRKREQLDGLISNVKKTIAARKGKKTMTDHEKFEGFKQKLIDDNEEKYGVEIREKYGDEAIDGTNAKIKEMSKEQHGQMEGLTAELNRTLKLAFETSDPAGELAQKAAALHKKWLCFYWTHYSKEAHIGVTQMYVDDPRFTAYYDSIVPGCAAFLRDAVAIYCK